MTLTEILVVLAALGVLVMLTALALKPTYQIAKGRDSRRKADLKRIATAVEDYGGDHPCYPVQVYEDANTCRPATGFAAYLNPVPCDPQTQKPYVYRRLDTPACKKYAIFATLELEKKVTYGPDNGNYVVSNVRLEPTTIPTTPGLTGTTTPPPGVPSEKFYGCSLGICVPLSGPDQCDPNYQVTSPCEGNACCFDMCGTPENPLHECD